MIIFIIVCVYIWFVIDLDSSIIETNEFEHGSPPVFRISPLNPNNKSNNDNDKNHKNIAGKNDRGDRKLKLHLKEDSPIKIEHNESIKIEDRLPTPKTIRREDSSDSQLHSLKRSENPSCGDDSEPPSKKQKI